MNYIKHLTGFFIRIASEETIYPTHISLYLALFQSWNINRFKNPIAISRDEMMKTSRIASKATYHKTWDLLIIYLHIIRIQVLK